MSKSKYIIDYGDGTYEETDSFFKWCVFSRRSTTKKEEEFESKVLKWFLIIFVGFLLIALMCIRITKGSI